MNLLQHSESMNRKTSDLQIWNNAAFDNGEPENLSTIKSSWYPKTPIYDSLDSTSCKENQTPVLAGNSVFSKSPALIKPLHPNGAIGNLKTKPIKAIPKSGIDEKSILKGNSKESMLKKIDMEIEETEKEIKPIKAIPKSGIGEKSILKRNSEESVLKKIDMEVEETEKEIKPVKAILKRGIGEKSILKRSSEESMMKKIDMEIEETEKEIKRLSCRLDILRLEKVECNLKMVERRGRVIPAKFRVQKQSDKIKKQRRGFSLGPSEIVTGAKSGQLGKQEIIQISEITPVQSIRSRRKSCFWKLQGIEEEVDATKERRKSLNLSSKSRKPLFRAQIPRHAVTTVGLKKSLKKEDGVLQSIQPKNLFKDGEKSVPVKKTFKPGRVIASRYNQSNGNSTANSAIRKRSLLENDKGYDRKRGSTIGKPCQSIEDENSEMSISFMADMLPKIRTFRSTNETPRDSGPAKKVAELIGKRSFFNDDEVADMSVCQELCFEEK